MNLLIIGLLIFFGIHLLPFSVSLRNSLIERIGTYPYKGLFALTALLGLGFIGAGMSGRVIMPIWEAPTWASHLAIVVILPAFVLLVAAYMPSNVKRYTRHPMLWGVTLWAGGHLPANGDLGSILLFGSFMAYSLFDMWSANRRGAAKSNMVRPLSFDIGVVAVGIFLYALTFYLHPYIFGVPIITM